jgi:hypothetical protein
MACARTLSFLAFPSETLLLMFGVTILKSSESLVEAILFIILRFVKRSLYRTA